jgi:four helix bundle protein
MDPYEKFRAWRPAHELALEIHRVTRAWPAHERYGLVSQIRRAAYSVPVNIVEGRARFGAREFRRFLDIAWGSLAEVGYALRYARDLGYLSQEAYESLEARRADAGRPLFALLRSLSRPAD